eukprot:g20263.t1
MLRAIPHGTGHGHWTVGVDDWHPALLSFLAALGDTNERRKMVGYLDELENARNEEQNRRRVLCTASGMSMTDLDEWHNINTRGHSSCPQQETQHFDKLFFALSRGLRWRFFCSFYCDTSLANEKGMQQQALVASLYNRDRHLSSSAQQAIAADMLKWQDQKVEEEVVFPAYAK